MFNLSRLFGDRQIDDWCENHILAAAGLLNQLAVELIVAAEEDLKSAIWKDGLIASSSFIAEHIAPKVRELSEPKVLLLLDGANAALGRIVAYRAIWHQSPEAPIAATGTFEGWQDVAFAIGPLAGGAAAAAAVPLAAVTTTTAWFGLVVTTTISWPVVVGGVTLAGAGIATGLLNTSRLWDKTLVRLRKKVRAFIVRTLIDGKADELSILDQVTATLRATAEQANALR